jgi:DnaJ-class molecular chaperone
LALKWHPDKRGNSEEANKKMRDINKAFEALNNGKGSVTKYGYDYGEEIEERELAVSKKK